MTVRINQVLTFAQYRQMGDVAVANGMYRNDKRVFLPGMAWFEPWYYDPLKEYPELTHTMCKERPVDPNHSFLSPHYWRDWADKRPPIAVVCPNGDVWEIDRRSSNGDGWRVTGELPNITCTPSIAMSDYHGWLTNGEFRLA
jgi:hypothetical protein